MGFSKKNQKAALELDTLVLLALGAVIILFVLYLVFQNTILDWFRNLPGYDYDDDDRVVDSLPDDYYIQMNYFRVARILDGKRIKFCTEGDCDNLRDSKLYWHGNERDGEIYVDQKGIFNWDWIDKDDKIGIVKNGRVNIYDSVVEGGGKLYREVKDDLPSMDDMNNLEGSIYVSGILYRNKEWHMGDEDVEPKRISREKDILFGLSQVFEYKSGLVLWIKYENGHWWWSEEKDRDWLIATDIKMTAPINFPALFRELDSERQQFIGGLRGESYESGVSKVMEKVRSVDGSANLIVFVDGDHHVYAGKDPRLDEFVAFIYDLNIVENNDENE